ncbi:hypothetical protein [Burkholderia lata]|uniref:hypothetical protein n=1 Tax=Burkholderia lata (strain ATCC 17760 / DSM 23089 / LMG 22485 / NCIMB 9086 / R18194 / 383) TaxID=482957 RepID=UPI0005A08C72|nr:hypothetical protein [Burkholderia lata]
MTNPFSDTVINDQRQWILSEYGAHKIGILPFCALKDIEDLRKFPSEKRHQHPLTLSTIKGASDKSREAHCASLGYRVMWTRFDNDDYAEDFATFLRNNYENHPGKVSGFHADHVFSQKRAAASSEKWTAMALCSGPLNSSHGAGLEKQIIKGINSDKEMRLLDTIGLFKCFGMRLRRTKDAGYMPTDAEMQTIATLLDITVEALKQDLQTLTQRIAFRPLTNASSDVPASHLSATSIDVAAPDLIIHDMTEEEQQVFSARFPERR